MRTTYGLKCTSCEEQYEVTCEYEALANIIKDAVCPKCGAPLRRHYGLGGIKFNGTGWGGGGGMI